MGVYTIEDLYGEDTLCHHGIKGQKWGVRNYQKPDGTYTEEGKKRYFGAQRQKNISTETSSGVHTRGKAPGESSPHRDKNGNPEPIGQSRWTQEWEGYVQERMKNKWPSTSPVDTSSAAVYNDLRYPTKEQDSMMTFGNINRNSQEYKIVQRDPTAIYADGQGNFAMSISNATYLQEAGIDIDELDDFIAATGKKGILHINKQGIAGFPFTYIKELANKNLSDDMIPLASHFMNKKGKTQKIGPNSNDRPKGHYLPKKKPIMSGTNKIIYFDEPKKQKKLKKQSSFDKLTQKYMVQSAKNVAFTKAALTEFKDDWKSGYDTLKKKKKR